MRAKSFAHRHDRRGFTLIEMLITLALIAMLGSMALVLFSHARARARAIRCLTNQQQIAGALVGFYNDKGRFPSDEATSDLAIQLSAYIHWPGNLHGVKLPDVYFCPNDRTQNRLANSYQPYYVQRREPSGSDYFVLGCPRHAEVDDAYINLHGLNRSGRAKPGKILINGINTSVEAGVASRSANRGVLTFEDGSTVSIRSSSDTYKVTAVASFRQEDGRLYTLVRVTGRGEADFSVTPGSRFEVVAPAALIGVKGTTFTVASDVGYSKVKLTSGAIRVHDRATGSLRTLMAPGTIVCGKLESGNAVAVPCGGCPNHCRAPAHCDRCPLHVRYPQYIETVTCCVQCARHCDKAKGLHCPYFCPLRFWAITAPISRMIQSSSSDALTSLGAP